MIEIEKKFLARAKQIPFVMKHVVEIPDLHEYDTRTCNGTPGDCYQRIEQGYVYGGKYGEIRIRQVSFLDGKRDQKIALKIGNGFKRIELERGTGERIYSFLRPYARMLTKVRVEVDGWSVDFFTGRHRGLVLAEYEDNNSKFEWDELLPPEGLTLVRDVTEERTYANKNLAKLSASEMRSLAMAEKAKEGVDAV